MSQTNDNPMDRAPEGVTAPARPSQPAACYVDTRTPEERAHDAAHPPALTTYLAAPREDTRRLDELERMANQPGGILLHDGSETGRLGIGLRPGALVRTLRQAIDDAAPSPEEA